MARRGSGKTGQAKRAPKKKSATKKRKRASGKVRALAEFLDERLAKAMAHGLRINIMAVARWREISPSEYARESGVPLNRVSYHFRKLVEYGALELMRTEPVRGGTKHYYTGTRQAIFAGTGWEQLPKSIQDGVAGAALQDFTKVAVRALEGGTFSARDDSYLTWDALAYDDLAFMAMVNILTRTRGQLLALAQEAKPRLAKTEQKGIQVAVALSGFEMSGM